MPRRCSAQRSVWVSQVHRANQRTYCIRAEALVRRTIVLRASRLGSRSRCRRHTRLMNQSAGKQRSDNRLDAMSFRSSESSSVQRMRLFDRRAFTSISRLPSAFTPRRQSPNVRLISCRGIGRLYKVAGECESCIDCFAWYCAIHGITGSSYTVVEGRQ